MNKRYFLLAVLIIVIPVFGKLVLNNFDTSVFIVAGKKFVNEAHLPYRINVIEGPGYDGQFYFKTALDLFSSKSESGISYDAPSYRKQRIVYPLISWLLAFGQPKLIPISMILVNCMSLLIIWYIFFTICKKRKLNLYYSVLPILYSGFHIALGRDLAEPLEAFLVLGLLWILYFFSNNILFYVLATLCFLTRETTIIYILPISIAILMNKYRQKSLHITSLVMVFSPYILFLFWKILLNYQFNENNFLQNTSAFTYPFYGLLLGFSGYFNNITLISLIRFSLALLNLFWLLWLIYTVYPYIKKSFADLSHNHYSEIAWISWITFSLFFSKTIYEDDYGFLRIFATLCTISFFILFLNSHKLSKRFCIATAFMFLLTTFRLWVIL